MTSLMFDPVVITVDDVARLGSVDDALANYFDDVVRGAAALGVPEREIRSWFEHELVSDSGFRSQVANGPGRDAATLRHLVDSHLVRRDTTRGTTWYELSHDRLVAPISASNAHWRDEHLHAVQLAAGEWDRSGRSAELLIVGRALTQAERWASEHPGDLLPMDSEFLAASADANEKAAAKTRANRRTLIVAIIGAFAVLIALGTGASVVSYQAGQASPSPTTPSVEVEGPVPTRPPGSAPTTGESSNDDPTATSNPDEPDSDADLQEQLTQARAEADRLSDDVTRLSGELAAAKAAAEESDAEIQRLSQQLAAAEERAGSAAAEVTRLSAQLAAAEAAAAEATQLRGQLTAAQADAKRSAAEVTQLREQLRLARAEAARATAEVAQLRDALTAAQAENAALSSELAAEQLRRRTADAGRLALTASRLVPTDLRTAELLAVESFQLADTPAGRRALREATTFSTRVHPWADATSAMHVVTSDGLVLSVRASSPGSSGGFDVVAERPGLDRPGMPGTTPHNLSHSLPGVPIARELSADDSLFAVGALTPAGVVVNVWDVATEELIATFPSPASSSGRLVLAVDADAGLVAVSGGDETTAVHDISTGSVIASTNALGDVHDLHFLDAATLAVGQSHGFAYWAFGGGTVTHHDENIVRSITSHDDLLVLSQDAEILVVRAGTGTQVCGYTGHAGRPGVTVVLPGDIVVSAGRDALHLWNLRTCGEPIAVLPVMPIDSLALQRTTERLVGIELGGRMHSFDTSLLDDAPNQLVTRIRAEGHLPLSESERDRWGLD